MKTGISASDRVYSILDVVSLKAMLDGMIYKAIPVNADLYQKRNVTVSSLTSMNDFINEHVVNVNIYAPELFTGQPDEETLNEIAEEVFILIEDYNSANDYCNVEIVGNGIIVDDNNRSYLNIRLEILTE